MVSAAIIAPYKGIPSSIQGSPMKRASNCFKKISNTVEHVWSYLGKTVIITRQSLNASIKWRHRFSLNPVHHLKAAYVVTRLKLFSIVSVPFTVANISSTAQKIFKAIKLKDNEGIALASLSLVILSSDLIDSLATFINALLVTLSLTPSELLSATGMPLAFTMLGLGAISRSIQIVKTHLFFKNFKAEVLSKKDKPEDFYTSLQTFLKENLSSEERKRDFLRIVPENAKEELGKLFTLLEAKDIASITEAEQIEIFDSLSIISDELKKKMKVDGGNLGANLIGLSGVALFFFSVNPALPFLVIAISFLLRLLLTAYQDLF